MNFDILIHSLRKTHDLFQQRAIKAVNINLTLRNWLVGYSIVEFEQQGEDRAKYGEQLLTTIAAKLNIKGLAETNLKLSRQFYLVYPQILGTMSQLFGEKWSEQISQTLPDQFQGLNYKVNTIRQSLSDESIKEKEDYFLKLLQSTSFSHFTELIKIDDHTKRRFYELLILKTTPSVRELQRQIQTLTYERFGLSQNKDVAFEQIQQRIVPEQITDIVKSHYFFEFLDIKYPYLIEENELEQALINHLQEFIIELGNGFCFEARQKRVLIGDEYFFIDLVFYHRILKCHVLIDLKTEKAKHTHIGQLKAYVQHYKKTVMLQGDNPPVGILLVTEQNKTLVEYAIAESDKELFVSKYLLQLPAKEILESFITNELRNL